MIFFFDCPVCKKRTMKRKKEGGCNARQLVDGNQVYRRRYQCLNCGTKATSYETLYEDSILPGHVKGKNGNSYKITERK